MRITHKLTLTILAISFISLGAFGLVSAQSQPMTNEQISRIKANCPSAKNIVAQLQTSDALLRVNRGQLYEYMTTKLMGKFNTRVENNHLNARSLVAVKDYYDNLLESFRSDYQSYAEKLNAIINIDCDQSPAEFYSAITLAREKRQRVHNDVIRLHQNIGEYKSALNAFIINFNRTSGGN